MFSNCDQWPIVIISQALKAIVWSPDEYNSLSFISQLSSDHNVHLCSSKPTWIKLGQILICENINLTCQWKTVVSFVALVFLSTFNEPSLRCIFSSWFVMTELAPNKTVKPHLHRQSDSHVISEGHGSSSGLFLNNNADTQTETIPF